MENQELKEIWLVYSLIILVTIFIYLFINGKQEKIDEELDYSMVDGKLSLDIDITSIEKKHNIRDSQISVLYKHE